MNIGERFDDDERKLSEKILFPSQINTDNINEEIQNLKENQYIMIKSHNSLIHDQDILKDERDELFRELSRLRMEIDQLKNKNKSKKIKYGLVGVLSFATIFSAIILPDFVKLLSIGFLCPLVNQLYYLIRDK